MRTEGAHQHSSTLRDYLRVVRRRRWIILSAVILVPLAAVLLSVRQESMYQASAEVLLSQQNLAAALTGTTSATPNQLPDRVAQTQADLARVPEVASRTLAAVGVQRSPGALLGHSSVAAKSNADLLEFTVTDHSPELAATLASAYAKQYVLYRQELDTASLQRARAEVRVRIRQLEKAGTTRDSPLREPGREGSAARDHGGAPDLERVGGAHRRRRHPGAAAPSAKRHSRPRARARARTGSCLPVGGARHAGPLGRRDRRAARAAVARTTPCAAAPAAKGRAVGDARRAARRPGRGVPDAAYEPRVRPPRPRRADDHGLERRRPGGQVDHRGEPRGRARPRRPARRARGPRSAPALPRPLLRPAPPTRAHPGRARPDEARRRADPDRDHRYERSAAAPRAATAAAT